MLNLGALDVIISLVVVLLVLSLVVQSIQQLVKKVLKLKSRTIESSLGDLLGKVVTPIGGAAAASAATAAPAPAPPRGAFRRLFGKARAEEGLVVEVIDELKSLGRRTLFNQPILDSIAKDDVVKVLTKIGASRLYPAYRQRFQEVEAAIAEVVQALDAAKSVALTGSTSAKLASVEGALAPLAYDLASLSDGQQVKATAVVGDLIGVRRVQMQSILATLGEVQDQVKQDIAAAQAAGQPTDGLTTVATALRAAADGLKRLGTGSRRRSRRSPPSSTRSTSGTTR